MSEKLKLSTSSVDPHHRVDFWRATVADSFAPVEIRDYQTAGFAVDMVVTTVGSLSVTQVDAVPQTYVRGKSLIKSGDCDDYVISIQRTRIRYATNNRDGVAVRDSITLYDLACPFTFQALDPSCSYDVHIPRNMFERAFGPASNAIGLMIGADYASSPIVRGFFRNLMESSHLFDPTTATRMAAIGVDLLVAGFAEQLAHEPRMGIGSATLVYRAKTFIEEHLWNAGLDTAAIAAALHLSIRRLQEVFAEQALTVDGYLWERRLAKACLQLRDPAFDAVSVASIGYGVGFVSASHFARRFRQRFTMTPTEYREKGRRERETANGV